MCWLCLLTFAAAVSQPPQDVPFQDWLKGKDDTRIRWQLHVPPAQLSERQRLETFVGAFVDGDEFVKRGPLLVFLQILDRENRPYRIYTPLIPEKDQNPAEAASINWVEQVCVTPGDYDVAVAVYDTRSKEHSLKRTKLHVPDLSHDPLPGLWRDLPSVELSNCVPDESQHLFLPLKTVRPARVELLMNQSVNRNPAGNNRSADRLIHTLGSRLVVLSQMQVSNGSLGVTLLDVERRKVSFAEEVSGLVSLQQLWEQLGGEDRLKIDLHSLENYKEDAQFFVSEIRKRLEGGEPAAAARAVVVLSAPLAFPKGEDLQPIEATPPPGSRIYYIRCDAPSYPPGTLGQISTARGGMRGAPRAPMMRSAQQVDNSDSLEGTLKPLNPRLFDVTTPAEFRSALAAILSEISQQK